MSQDAQEICPYCGRWLMYTCHANNCTRHVKTIKELIDEVFRNANEPERARSQMVMTVQKLISLLKKMPPRASVAWQDHDHGDEEFNGYVGQVAEASDFLRKERGIGVVIRPQ